MNSGDTAWLLVASALVMLMTPALGFFYGGLVDRKNVLSTIMHSVFTLALVSVVWVLWGYGMTSAPGVLGGLVGNPFADLGLSQHVGSTDLVGIGYGATFAIITVALISGAIADRTRFASWAVFVPVWVTLVYCPLAFMVWGGGLLSADGLIDQRLPYRSKLARKD